VSGIDVGWRLSGIDVGGGIRAAEPMVIYGENEPG
jgi:hypothetical protein